MLGNKQEKSDVNVNRRSEDVISLSSSSSFSDLATADDEDQKPTITSPVSESKLAPL